MFGSASRPPDQKGTISCKTFWELCCPSYAFSYAHARADETAAKSRIVAVGLFKNGLAVIKREVPLGKAGTYVLGDVPEPATGPTGSRVSRRLNPQWRCARWKCL